MKLSGLMPAKVEPRAPRDGEVWRPRAETIVIYVEERPMRQRCPVLGEWLVMRKRKIRRRTTTPAKVIVAGWQGCWMEDSEGRPFGIATQTLARDWIRVGARHLALAGPV